MSKKTTAPEKRVRLCLRRPNRRGKPLALPLGELSPQATERALQYTLSVLASLGHLSQGERQEPTPHLALPLGELPPQATERVLGQRLPSPSSLRSATSPKGRGKRGPLALPLGELSPKVTERGLQAHSAFTLSVLASLGHLSQGERQGGVSTDYQPCSSSIPAFTRSIEVSLPSSAQSSVAPPGVDALPDTATRSGHRMTEFLTSSFAASATSAS